MTSLEDKENASENKTVIVIEDTPVNTRKQDIHSFFSPPRKKTKQDPAPLTTPNGDKNNQENHCKKDLDNVVVLNDEGGLPESPIEKRKSPVNKQTKNNTTKKASPKTPMNNNHASFKNRKSPGSGERKSPNSGSKPTDCSPLPFPKVSKEDALKETEKELQGSVDKHTSPLTKEERQRLKEEKEQQKVQRLKEAEEKKRKREEDKINKQAEKEKRDIEKKEKEKLREEEKKVREEEKKKKDEQKEAERVKKEEERKKKEEEKEAERLKKEEERKKKDEEKQKKEELQRCEKEKKEQERKQKEEAKRLEEEKKKQDEDALRKKKEKEANHFKSFFTKKKSSGSAIAEQAVTESYQRFKPFQIKQGMVMAPIVRNTDIDRKVLDNIMENVESRIDESTYLRKQSETIKEKGKPKYLSRRKKRRELEGALAARRKENIKQERKNQRVKQGVSCPGEGKEEEKKDCSKKVEEVVVINDDSNDLVDADGEDTEEEGDVSLCEKTSCLYIAKLLQFSENTRPAYYGTWRKTSKHISGRKPFGMDHDIFNYDVDSDEEWIDEPGENLSDDAEDDKEEDEKETEDDQDGFFVPHGYLSDDEGIEDQGCGSDDEEDDGDKPAPSGSKDLNENRKLKEKVCTLEADFERKLKQRKPICIGITYPATEGMEDLNPLMIVFKKVPLFKPEKSNDEGNNADEGDREVEMDDVNGSPPASQVTVPAPHVGSITALTVPEEGMPLLIRFLHGNTNGLERMNAAFREYWSRYVKQTYDSDTVRSVISKRQLERKIQTIATRVMNNELGKMCYVVNKEVIESYKINDLKLGGGLPELKSSTETGMENKSSGPSSKSEGSSVEKKETSMEIN